MLPRTLLIGGLAALTLPAAASAATLATDGSAAVYTAAPGDKVEVQVYSGWDTELGATASFFLPVGGNQTDPTTGDAACRARPAGASSCARTTARLRLAEQDDFVGVGAAGDTVEIHLGAGDDRSWSNGSKVVTYGEAGNDTVQGGPGFDRLDGGPGDDTLDPNAFGDVVTGGTGFDTVRYSGHTEPVIVTLDDVANDGRRATAGHGADGNNIGSDVEQVVGGSNDDELEGNASANTLRGGDGADVLTGNGGADTLIGDAGADTIAARDGAADTIDCGPGADTAVADAIDDTTSCETVLLPATPPTTGGQGGGPGPMVPVPVPPVTTAPTGVVASVTGRWGLGRRVTTVFELAVKRIPAGGRVELRCAGRGCPFARRVIAPTGTTATLTRLFAQRRLRRGTVIELRVTAPGLTGKVVRYTMRARRKLPRTAPLCLPAGASTPTAC